MQYRNLAGTMEDNFTIGKRGIQVRNISGTNVRFYQADGITEIVFGAGNVDGGSASSVYGSLEPVDGGSATS